MEAYFVNIIYEIVFKRNSLTNQACEWEETYGQTCLIYLFIFFNDKLDLPVKETDKLYWCVQDFCLWQGSEPLEKKKKKKKKIFLPQYIVNL